MPSNKSFLKFFFYSVFATCISCRKFVEISPSPTQIVGTNVYASDATATAALIGIYSQMMNNSYPDFANGGITLYSGLSADEFNNYVISGSQPEFYYSSLTPTNIYVRQLWGSGYNYVYGANSVLEGLEKSTGVTLPIKNQLEGEAKFIRALCHFYLVNLFGDIPYIVTTSFPENSAASRLPKLQVYQKIIEDLTAAQNLLPNDYSHANGERVRPNKWAATSLLSRTYLYVGDWISAEVQATAVINNTDLYSIDDDLNDVFLKNSSETILQLMPGQNTGLNTREGNSFILTSPPTIIDLSLSLLNAFEAGDNRRTDWVGSITFGSTTYYYPYKYKIKTDPAPIEYYMVLRLAELYLVRAEARAQQNNVAGSQADLNTIRNRARLLNTTADTLPALLSAIEQERRVEFFSEWGHRWLDLKRTDKADLILGPLKSPDWQPPDVLYPIPLSQLQNSPGMTQNPGY